MKTIKSDNNHPLSPPVVGVIMGSQSDYLVMNESCKILTQMNIKYEVLIVSAHRTPERLYDYAKTASQRCLKIIIAGAGGAAHLPGMTAALTVLPVLGVPIYSEALHGVDSLLSIVQMPKGVPVATFAIGKAGAINAAIFAASILALHNDEVAKALQDFRRLQTTSVAKFPE